VSISVDVDELPDRIAEYGTLAFLLTVGEGPRAHVVSAQVEAPGGGLLRAGAGRRTRANLAADPAATLVWPPGPDGQYCLIVDVEASGALDGEGPVELKAQSAILHVAARPAGEPRAACT
jgi:hypothetical protein